MYMSDEHQHKKAEVEEVQIVSFMMRKETYGIDVAQIREIGKVDEITRIPRVASYIEGVMNLRGQITTVIDLRKRFSLEDGVRDEKTRIIVAEIGGMQLGIIVDSVQDVIRIPVDTISAVPKSLETSIDTKFLTGICKQKDGLIILLNMEAMLSSQDVEQMSDVVSVMEPKEETR